MIQDNHYNNIFANERYFDNSLIKKEYKDEKISCNSNGIYVYVGIG